MATNEPTVLQTCNGESEFVTVGEALGAMSGHLDMWYDEPAHWVFDRTGFASTPHAVFRVVKGEWE